MKVSEKLNCNGLSVAPTVLRIKQALIGNVEKKLPLEILVGEDCDLEHLASSLGSLSKDVRLVAHPA